MSYAAFLSSLLESGRVTVPEPGPVPEAELRAGDQTLAAFERSYRLELPGEPPPPDPPAARWAGVTLFRACQFAVFRDIGAEVIERELSARCPSPPLLHAGVPARRHAGTPGAAVHYSVDLVFRFLPDLAKFARSTAENDPLVTHLMRLAREWPLSSVGMAPPACLDARMQACRHPGGGDVDIDGFASHAGLLVLYCDRVIARRDKSRLADPRVCDAVRRALGMHKELAPEMMTAIEAAETQELPP